MTAHRAAAVAGTLLARLSAVCAGALLLAAPMGTVRAESPCAGDLVVRIQTAYQALSSFKARFTQEDRLTDGQPIEAEGTVAYLKPGRMRWEYAPPHEQLLVTDGETVWLYDPLLDNVTVQPLGELTQGTPLAFLLGAGNLQEDFDCRAFTRPPPQDGLAYVELVPRQEIPALAYIQLGALADSGRIAALRMVDGQDNVREVRFFEMRTNVSLDPAAFTFEIEPGMEVIRKEAP